MTNQYTEEQIEALGPGFVIDDFELLWRAIGRLPFLSNEGPYAWRGVSNSAFHIQSSLYRELVRSGINQPSEVEMRQEEERIIANARSWGLGRIGAAQISDLQLLTALQHEGVPTRLLDVTANPLTALWFACQDSADGAADGLLIAFNLAGLESVSAELERPTWGSLSDPAWHLRFLIERSAENSAPFVVRATFLGPRMAAQEGFFLGSACALNQPYEYREVPRPKVDGMFVGESGYVPGGAAEYMLFDDHPEFTQYPRGVWSFVIPAEMKLKILPVLESTFNRTAATLFPDVAGFRDWRAKSSNVTRLSPGAEGAA